MATRSEVCPFWAQTNHKGAVQTQAGLVSYECSCPLDDSGVAHSSLDAAASKVAEGQNIFKTWLVAAPQASANFSAEAYAE